MSKISLYNWDFRRIRVRSPDYFLLCICSITWFKEKLVLILLRSGCYFTTLLQQFGHICAIAMISFFQNPCCWWTCCTPSQNLPAVVTEDYFFQQWSRNRCPVTGGPEPSWGRKPLAELIGSLVMKYMLRTLTATCILIVCARKTIPDGWFFLRARAAEDERDRAEEWARKPQPPRPVGHELLRPPSTSHLQCFTSHVSLPSALRPTKGNRRFALVY